jgi:hypothetical protein
MAFLPAFRKSPGLSCCKALFPEAEDLFLPSLKKSNRPELEGIALNPILAPSLVKESFL